MNDNRDKLKQLARGCSTMTDSDAGFDIDLWEFLDNGEYNQRAVDACVSLLRWYKQENGTTDRQSGFFQYIHKLKEQGYEIEINQAQDIDTQTGAIVQVEATRMYITSDMGARETDAEVVLSFFKDADDCGYHTTLSADQTKELIKRLQSLYEGIKAYNEVLHDAREVRR